MQTEIFGKQEVGAFRELLEKYASKTDVVMPTGLLNMTEDGRLETKQYVSLDEQPVEFSAKPTNWAYSQIGNYLGIHASYMNKMTGNYTNADGSKPRPAFDLLAQNVNYWFSRHQEKRLCRVFDGELIGFLSDHYKAIDNYDIVSQAYSVAREVANNMGHEVEITRSYLTESTMSVTLLTTGYVDLEPGNEKERYRMGVHLRNSEVGNGAFTVLPLLMRTSCMNSNIFTTNYYGGNGGRVDNYKFKKVHRGKELAPGVLWSDDTQKLQDATTMSEIKDITAAAFNKEIAEGRIVKMRGLRDEKFTPMPQRVVATRKLLNLTKEENEAIWNRIEANNRYEYVQAVTNYAQVYFAKGANAERGTELENMGGRLFSERAIWDQIEADVKRNSKEETPE